MAVPINFLINSPHDSSDEEYNDADFSSSSEDEPSQTENTNGGSHSSLPNLERQGQETERNGTEEEEFWVRYPYLKELLEIIVSQGWISEKDGFERVKLIGEEKAKELNDGWKALCLKEEDLSYQLLNLLPSPMNPGI